MCARCCLYFSSPVSVSVCSLNVQCLGVFPYSCTSASLCLCVHLCACLLVFLCTRGCNCLSVFVFTNVPCLSVCLYSCSCTLFSCMSVCLSVCLLMCSCINVYLHFCKPVCVFFIASVCFYRFVYDLGGHCLCIHWCNSVLCSLFCTWIYVFLYAFTFVLYLQ